MSRTYNLPGSHIKLEVAYSIKRSGDIELFNTYLGEDEIDTDILYVKEKCQAHQDLHGRTERVVPLTDYLQRCLNEDASDILSFENFRDAAE